MHPASGARDGAEAGAGALVWLLVAGLVYCLILGVALIGDGFVLLSGGTEGARRIFSFATNPVVGVLLGTLATALLQSSSAVTSVIVALVASGLPVELAVPMIMGANMGTTVTNTLVSLGTARESDSFRQAFAAATVHDMFNFLSILIFLPLELLFRPLQNTAGFLAGSFSGLGFSLSGFDPVDLVVEPVARLPAGWMQSLPERVTGLVLLALGILAIVLSVFLLAHRLKTALTGRAKRIMDAALGKGRLVGMGAGAVVTLAVQSSSTTTSLIVPLAGAGKVTLRQVYPFTLGANIGTTITALLVAMAVSGGRELALHIALVHLLYNLFGVLLILLTPGLRELPIEGARRLGDAVSHNRFWAVAYLFGVFFLLPGVVLYLQQQTVKLVPSVEAAAELHGDDGQGDERPP